MSSEKLYTKGLRVLAKFHKEGTHSLEKSDSLAFNYELKAANLNDSTAQYKVAVCYENGIGTEININKAFYYLRSSAE